MRPCAAKQVMSQIQELTLQEAEKFVLGFFSAAVGVISDVSIFAIQNIEQAYLKYLNQRSELNEGGEKTFEQFKNLLRKTPPENVLSLRVPDDEIQDYKRFLKQEKKVYVVLDDLQTNSQVILFRERDRNTVENIQKLVGTIHKEQTEINPKVFLKGFENADISIVSGLNRNELELFRYFIKETPCLHAVVSDDNGNYTVLYKPEDVKKVNKALHLSNWCFNGEYKELVKEQVEYRIKGRNKINLDLEDAAKEFYIVSKSNPKNYVHVSEKEISYYKNEMEIHKISRDFPDFKARTWLAINSLSSPAIFEPEEFSMDVGERQAVLDTKMTLDEFPQDMFVEEEMLKYNRMRDLISLKMNLDDEFNADWALYDTSVSFAEFGGQEHLDDIDAMNQKERDFDEMKASYKDTISKYKKETLTVDNQSLDYIIAKTEREMAGNRSESHEHTFEQER